MKFSQISQISIEDKGKGKEREKPVTRIFDPVDQSESKVNLFTGNKPNKLIVNNPNITYFFKGGMFLLLLIVTYFIITYFYMLLHGIYLLDLLSGKSTISSFTWIGNNSNPLSVGIEIQMWSLLGIICLTAYGTGKAILNNEFEFCRSLIMWMSSSLYGFGIAVAVVLSLSFISVSFGEYEISLRNAPIETIIAVSFILGFFNNEARLLLIWIRDKLSGGLAKKETEKVSQ